MPPRAAPPRPPVPTFLDSVQDLLLQLDRLKAVHRASETPTFGQVEALFDQAGVVRAALVRHAVGRANRPAAWPTTGSPVEQAARRLVTLIAQQLQQETATVKDVA